MSKKSIGGKGGFSMGPLTVLLMGVGLGFISDAMWYSLGLPGTKSAIKGCDMLKEGDVLQLLLAGGLTLLGFMMNIKILPPIMFGTTFGMLIPKIVTPYLGLPRYILFDYDPTTGSINPRGRLPQQPQQQMFTTNN